MPADLHRVRRLRWQVRAPSADAALAVRANLREWLPDIEAALARAFSQQGTDGDLRHLSSLSVNLRLPEAFSQHELMQELGTALGQALHDAANEMAAPLPPLWRTPEAREAPAASAHASADRGDRAPLLCALQAARQQAPDALRDALLKAVRAARDPREEGECDLDWLGHRWRVRVADAAHWLRSLAREAGPLDEDQQGSGDGGKPPLQDAAAIWRDGPPLAAKALGQPGPAAGSASHGEPADLHTADAQRVADAAQALRTPSGLQHLQAQLRHYLRTGQLDWVLSGLPGSHALAALREAASLWADWGLLPDALPANSPLAQRLGALSRWLALLSPDQRRAVADHHAARATPSGNVGDTMAATRALTMRWPALWEALEGASSSDSLHAQALWLDWQAAGGAAMGAVAFQHWWDQAVPWVEALQRQGPTSDAWQAWLASTPNASAPKEEAPSRNAPGTVTAQPTSAPASSTLLATLATRSAVRTPSAQEPATSTGRIVSQAGLVLLHAYLPRCLDALGLYPSGQRGSIAPHLWPRAAALLHHLAAGADTDTDTALECELGLIKLLLGRRDQHDEHEALSHSLPTLLPHEREEADALLHAVLGHWRALKGTSVAGLRGSFLQRRGWLESRSGARLLRVEPAPYDVLLGSLPWGMSLVRLPWMAQPLHVEWSAP